MSSVASVTVTPEKVAPVGRLWCPFHVTVAATIALFTFFFCGRSIADPDIWWHLRNAQILVQQHHWVRVDQFSYTVTGTPWVNSEWLSELVFYGIWKIHGVAALFFGYVAIVELMMIGILMLAYRASESIKASAVATGVAVVFAVVNFGPRTILLGWACLLALMFVLWKLMKDGDAPLWTVPLIFLLWVNLHGSWLIGLIVFGIVVGSGFVSGKWGKVVAEKWTPGVRRKLMVTAAAIVPVLFVNPYGYKGAIYPFDLAFRQKLNVSHVVEWASINFHEPRGKIVYGLLLALFLLALSGRRQWKLAEVGMVAFGLYMSLTYVRFLFPAAILIAPILARQMDFMPAYNRKVDRSWVNVLFSAALLAIIAWRWPTTKILNDDLAKKMPIGGTHYLQTHMASGERVFNHYMYGGWMIWNQPSIPTFVDSRTDIFEYKGVLADYLDAIGLKNSLAIVDRYRVKYIFFPSKDDPFTYFLRHTDGWHVVYDDGVSCVFERDQGKSQGATGAS
ncbi:MAG TPA: hypothetical protein VHW70_12765 [Edaphobacter sp.]|nr:hypothetical protein [Edaphobacter sp.]